MKNDADASDVLPKTPQITIRRTKPSPYQSGKPNRVKVRDCMHLNRSSLFTVNGGNCGQSATSRYPNMHTHPQRRLQRPHSAVLLHIRQPSHSSSPAHKHAIVIAGWPCDSVWPVGSQRRARQTEHYHEKSIERTGASPCPPRLYPLNSPTVFWGGLGWAGGRWRRTLPIIVFGNEWVVSSHVYSILASLSARTSRQRDNEICWTNNLEGHKLEFAVTLFQCRLTYDMFRNSLKHEHE